MTKRQRLRLVVLSPAPYAVTLFTRPAELVAAITAPAVALLLVAGHGVVPQAAPAWTRSLPLREKAMRTALLRLRDPDAAGRPRPRAPGLGLLTA